MPQFVVTPSELADRSDGVARSASRVQGVGPPVGAALHRVGAGAPDEAAAAAVRAAGRWRAGLDELGRLLDSVAAALSAAASGYPATDTAVGAAMGTSAATEVGAGVAATSAR